MNPIQNPKSKIQDSIIYPVILPVPEDKKGLRGRDKVEFLSRFARTALEISAEKSRIRLGELLKDEDGVPLPFEGYYWSLSHKSGYVAAVVAVSRIGIDVEEIRPCSEALFKKVADDAEWSLFNEDLDDAVRFFRCWTSKEAVLKATGTGFKGISGCRIKQVLDDNHLVVNYTNSDWLIEHFFFDGHLTSVVQNDFQVQWTMTSLSKR